MHKKHRPLAHGRITCRLQQLIETARTTWGIPVTRHSVAKSTGLSITTVDALYKAQSTLYDRRTLWKLCWYLNCGTADLLQWTPPPEHTYLVRPTPPIYVGSIMLPRKLPVDSPAIRIAIPEQLARVKNIEIIRGTGLAENTVAALLNTDHPPMRIAEKTLAAVLDFLSRRGGEEVALATLLIYDPPELSQGG